MNNPYIFNAPFVYVDSIENHSEIKKEYYSKILEYSKEIKRAPKNWKCQCKSSYNLRNINSKLFYDFAKIIWNSLDSMFSNVNLNQYPDKSILGDPNHHNSIWFNYYEKGQFQEAHNHQSAPLIINNSLYCASFSGIYIFHSDKEELGTTFSNTNIDTNTFLSRPTYTPKAEEGNIIWFPSILTHFASPALKERITISFNINSHYKHI